MADFKTADTLDAVNFPPEAKVVVMMALSLLMLISGLPFLPNTIGSPESFFTFLAFSGAW